MSGSPSLASKTESQTPPKRGGFVPDFGTIVEPGERVHALGHPLGGRFSRQPSIVSGQVSAATGMEDHIARFRMTAPINEGSSGGPVINARGELVGVAPAGLVRRGVEGIRFGTKISAAMLLMQQARRTRKFSISAVPRTSTPPSSAGTRHSLSWSRPGEGRLIKRIIRFSEMPVISAGLFRFHASGFNREDASSNVFQTGL